MSFELTDVDKVLSGVLMSINLESVDDVAEHPGTKIEFQFPPIIRSDKKEGKWHELMNVFSYEPKYMYQGAKTRDIQLEATYIVGGPPIGSRKADIQTILFQIRTWKKYFYIKNGGGKGNKGSNGGGIGSGQGKELPIWRINYMGNAGGLIGGRSGAVGSAWRCLNYNIKYSDEWIIDEKLNAHPLITTITVNLSMATGVDVTGRGDTKQDHSNIANKPFVEWY